MSDGDFFGERALSENKPRAATVFTTMDTHLAIINKNDFELVINDYRKIYKYKKDFLLKVFPFLKKLVVSTGKVFERIIRFF